MITAVQIENAGSSRCEPGTHRPHVPKLMWTLSLALAAIAAFAKNQILACACIVTVPILASLLWRRGESPILLACCLMQWLQIAVPVLSAAVAGEELETASRIPHQVEATWLSLYGLLACAMGMYVANRSPRARGRTEEESAPIRPGRAFVAWLIAFALAKACDFFAWQVGSLAQLLLAVSAMKWAILFVLFRAVLSQGRCHALMWTAMGLEISSGFLGFFSGFKDALFLLPFAALAGERKLRADERSTLLVGGVLLVVLCVAWQSIKGDYRSFLNQGTHQQVVVVPVEARINELVRLMTTVDAEKSSGGSKSLVERVGYTEFFARTIEWVPSHRPFENGRIWEDAVRRVFMPRVLFPDKSALDDSMETRLYTGEHVAGMESGTSIGIGYMAESYADFGLVWMAVPIFAFGCLSGLVFRMLAYGSGPRPWGMALAVAALFCTLHAFETSAAKLIGGLITSSLVLYTANYFFGTSLWRGLHYGEPEPGQRLWPIEPADAG